MKEKRKITEMEYIFASKRIDILLPLVTDKTPNDDPNYIELAIMTDVVWEYEEEHYPMDIPTPAALIEQAIIEKNMTRHDDQSITISNTPPPMIKPIR